jgi:probable F420-dependent oxidoreductase
VIASQFATLNEMYGNRTICGIGRGDSALRTLGSKPGTIDDMKACVHVVRELAGGRPVEYRGQELQLKWVDGGALEVWVAAYGPKALQATGEVGDGYILQLADPDIAAWMIAAVRRAAADSGRDPEAISFCVAAPAYVGDDLAHQRDQTRWFGGMVGNHVADIVSRYGDSGAVPQALTDYIKARQGYDYAEHGRAGNPHADFVPDEVIDRFCILGPAENHLARLKELQDIGVDQFAVYLQHDDKPGTLDAYGTHIIPALG